MHFSDVLDLVAVIAVGACVLAAHKSPYVVALNWIALCWIVYRVFA